MSVLTHISGTLWIAEIQLEGDDNVYRVPIEADSETQAQEQLERIMEQMESCLA